MTLALPASPPPAMRPPLTLYAVEASALPTDEA